MPEVIEKKDESPAAAPESDKTERSLERLAFEKKLRAKKKRLKRIKAIIAIVVLIAIGVGVYFLISKLFHEEKAEYEAMTQSIYRGSIVSMVYGYGQTMPKDSATIALASGGTVLEVFVAEGDFVTEGDPLYIIDDAAAHEAVAAAEEELADARRQLENAMKSYNDLAVRAPFSGTLLDAADIEIGDDVSAGRLLGTLVDDKTLKLELYFSYAYEDMIAVGQPVKVSVPALMNELDGKVAEVNFVRRVTIEGSVLFQAVVELENPGSLTDGMDASATLTDPGGEEIYPYEPGKLAYSRTSDILTKTSGPVVQVNLLSYAQVTEGQLLLEMGAVGNDEVVETLRDRIKTAQEAVDKAVANLQNFNAVAPMSGTVLSCTLMPGEEVPANKAVITIADTTTMIINANVDEMNIAFVKPGMYCDVVLYGRGDPQYFMGIVESVSLEAKLENGTAFFPATITVDNPDGVLMSGMGAEYSMVASQSEDCLVAPIQAVQYTMAGTCLFIRADEPPENVISDDELGGIEVPEGFYAVPVVIGIADNNTVEIISGVDEGTEVFTQLIASGGDGGMGGGMRSGIMVMG